MSLHGFFLRYRRLASWLSLVALCSALLAPASVLAQELRAGHWIGLCGTGSDLAPAGTQDGSDGGHCGLCALPGLALPPGSRAFGGPMVQAMGVTSLPAGLPAAAPALAAIRGPPHLF